MRIGTLNLANAVRDETGSEGRYRFGARFERIVALLLTLQLDMLCVQEVRACRRRDGDTRPGLWTPHEIITELGSRLDFDAYAWQRNNATELAFHKATFYNSKKFFALTQQTWWPSTGAEDMPGGAQFGQNVFGVSFVVLPNTTTLSDGALFPTNQAKSRLTVWNVHAPTSRAGRDAYMELLKKRCIDGPALLLGDFNSFPDAGGAEQMASLDETHVNVSQGCGPTFYSFEHDTAPDGSRYTSQLDHVLTTRDFPWKCTVEKRDISETQESDHFPLVVTLE